MNILAFIPARGGSKGIPKKNLALVAGKPLIQHTLELVKELGKSVNTIISTDDDEIAKYCERKGCDMEYRRPAHLAKDDSSIVDAVYDALEWRRKNDKVEPDAILLLQPTSPLRYTCEVRSAIKLFTDRKLESLVSVTPMREHPYECVEVNKEGWSYLRSPSINMLRRQLYPNKYYFVDGSIYLATTNFIITHRTFVKPRLTELFYLDRTWPVDIDTPDDILVADSLMRTRRK